MQSLDSLGAHRIGWIGLLTVATIAASLVFACATPFPALAALAALHMKRRDAFALTAVVWGTNQIIGYGLLHYPQTSDSFAWGIAIGASAMIATALAAGAERAVRPYGRSAAMLASGLFWPESAAALISSAIEALPAARTASATARAPVQFCRTSRTWASA